MRDVTTKSLTQTADGIVTREVRGEETDLIRVPVSSTRDDRDGDNFSEDALRGMQAQIQNEQPLVFLNHGFTSFNEPLYDARETIGTQVDAEIEAAKDDDEDKDLVALVLPDRTHPEGERLAEQVEQGQAVKFSVGFRVLEAEPKDPEAENDERRTFNAVDLMETSKVGIPANPDASATVAAKAATLAENLGVAGVDIDDPAEFASVLASELVRQDGPVTREDVEEATPVLIDGQPETLTRRQALNRAYLSGEADGSGTEFTQLMTTRDTKDEGDPCDDNGDCGDGMVCVDGECVPEDDDDDEEESATAERLDALEADIQRLTELMTEAVDDDDPVEEPNEPEETFSVEIDGETKEYSPDDIRELEAAAADGAAESKTVSDPGAHDGTEVGETEDTDPDEPNDDERSLQEEIYG